MNVNNILIISKFFVMRLTQNQKNQSTQYNSMVMLFEKIALRYSFSSFSRLIHCLFLCEEVMSVRLYDSGFFDP